VCLAVFGLPARSVFLRYRSEFLLDCIFFVVPLDFGFPALDPFSAVEAGSFSLPGSCVGRGIRYRRFIFCRPRAPIPVSLTWFCRRHEFSSVRAPVPVSVSTSRWITRDSPTLRFSCSLPPASNFSACIGFWPPVLFPVRDSLSRTRNAEAHLASFAASADSVRVDRKSGCCPSSLLSSVLAHFGWLWAALFSAIFVCDSLSQLLGASRALPGLLLMLVCFHGGLGWSCI
jgi:hypothetical protein